MQNIYSWNIIPIIGIMALCLYAQKALKPYFMKWQWLLLHLLCAAVAFLIIWHFTIWGREPSDNHQFLVISEYSDEFFRELFMNLFLYFPLGLTCSQFLGKKTIFIAFCISAAVECWQFRYGTGVAQATDVLCNTLGASVALIFWQYTKD